MRPAFENAGEGIDDRVDDRSIIDGSTLGAPWSSHAREIGQRAHAHLHR
jgi:hypothetical protein